MKKLFCAILAAAVFIPLAAGISFKSSYSPQYADQMSALAEGLEDDPESGCFSAMALRQYDSSLDLTSFGALIAGREIPKNGATAMKYALTVYACGVRGSVYDELDSQFLDGSQSTSALVFRLHLINNGLDVTSDADTQIQRLLERRLENGGFPTVGTTADIDMTAMAVQALAPYRSDAGVSEIIDSALSYLSSQQTATGAFRYFNSENSENCSQVILALTSLGIDPTKDERFIKDGVSVYDALLSYRLDDGSFEHVHGGGKNGAATSQAYCALVNMDRLTPFYVINEPQKTLQYGKQTQNNGILTPILVTAVCAVGAIICIIFIILKKKRVVDYVIVICVTAAVAVYLGISGVKTGEGYFSSEEQINVTGYVTVSVDCSLVSDKRMISPVSIGISDSDTAYSVLVRACRENGLTVSNTGSKITPYISGIDGIYESEYGPTSGWAYKVNGKVPSIGSGSYALKDGDVLEWLYVPDLSYLSD